MISPPFLGRKGARGIVERVSQHPPIGPKHLSNPTIYTHPECSYSVALKDELDEEGREYTEINLALRPEAWADLEKLTGGERITPVMVDGDEVMVGFHGVG